MAAGRVIQPGGPRVGDPLSIRTIRRPRLALTHSLFTHAFTCSVVQPARFYQRRQWCAGYALNVVSGGSKFENTAGLQIFVTRFCCLRKRTI